MIPEEIKQQLIPTPKMDVRFYDQAELDGNATVEAGRPVHRAALYISIAPTSKDLVVKDRRSRKAKPADREQYPYEYAKYEAEKKATPGRPLALLPSMTLELEADLQALGINSIEQLAEIDPRACAEHLLRSQRYDEMDEAGASALMERATRAARSIPNDFATQISEAKYYAGLQQSAPAAVGAGGGDRIVPSRRPDNPVPALASFSYSF